MRRFFFSLLSSLCLRQPPRDPEPGGLAAGRAQRRRRRRARTQPGPGPPRARHSLPTPAAALRSAPLRSAPTRPRQVPPAHGLTHTHTETHTHTHAEARARSRLRGRGAEAGASCAAAQLARRRCAQLAAGRRPRLLPSGLGGAAALCPAGAGLGRGGGGDARSGAGPGVALPRRRPQSSAGLRGVRARVTPPAAPAGGRGGAGVGGAVHGGYRVCAHARG